MPRPILSLSKAGSELIRLKTITWICKPCGARFKPPADASDDAVVRCPSCQAKLGRLAAFKTEDAGASIRARQAVD